MDAFGTRLFVRPAGDEDYHRLVNLIHFETFVHRHLDWLSPLDWLNYEPFLVATLQDRLIGVLSSPVEPEGVAWIRLFGMTADWELSSVWNSLWPAALRELQSKGKLKIAALPLHGWFADLLIENGFEEETNVVFLAWQRGRKTLPEVQTAARIRPMTFLDLEQVTQVDAAAFSPMWRNSFFMLEAAYKQSAVATVAEDEQGQVVGYQISTAGNIGGHLARLAVLPDQQGKQIGSALVSDMLGRFNGQEIRRVSVNTQANNPASLKLYTKLGFKFTGESYPVLKFDLN